MAAAVGRVWGWVRPALSYRPWGGKTEKDDEQMGSGWTGMTTWFWPGGKKQSDQEEFTKQQWEMSERAQPMEVEEFRAGRLEMETPVQTAPRWWRRMLPSSYFSWPRRAEHGAVKAQRCVGQKEKEWDCDQDGGESDYGTPPPSPTPRLHYASPFRFFMHSWTGEVLPEHYEICFNFLRHLFDLFVVGFLWTVSPPVRVVLDILGVQGTLKLWIHGMAMFFVSTVGMAGLLWLIQEYLPQFALVYGILQVLVISVSLHQSVVLGEAGEAKREEEAEKRQEQEMQGETDLPKEGHDKGKTVQ
ncbi:hypothetical protein Z043_114758 [Scleropages formosus]|uniref:Uncharacterized protein n=1 Tax=Scleropages formosus TaxID=113540 RepID=A0A0P7WSN7_SCLFO|nr:hypothetical protein Z043_114758 [Scleropages formosus]